VRIIERTRHIRRGLAGLWNTKLLSAAIFACLIPVWETTLPLSAIATPITYEIDGRQYVVIGAGGQRDPSVPSGGIYIAFALPE
jgi:hypothetical protein